MKKSFYILISLVFVLISCTSNNKENKVTYLPFQSEKNGRWGLIGTDGKILFQNEFKNEPTVARNGRFMVKNNDDLWEIYTAEAKPKKIGQEYVSAGSFIEDVAPVTTRNKCIDFIDINGNIKFTLNKVNGKLVTAVSNFSEGLARFVCNDNYGCIDKQGNVVIEPQYYKMAPCSDGKIIAVDKKYKDYEKKGKQDRIIVSVLNKKGKLLFEFKVNKFDNFSWIFENGEMAVKDFDDNNDPECGLIDSDGKWTLKPSKKIADITKIKGENYIFYDGDSYGVKNFKGENLIRAKYDYLFFAADNLLFAGEIIDKSIDFKLIDLKDTQIGKDKYKFALPFFNNKNAAVKVSKNQWTFIDNKGKEIENIPDIYNIDYNTGDLWIESDYIDLDAFVEDIKMTTKGIDAFNKEMTPRQILIAADANNDTTIYGYKIKWCKYLMTPKEYYGIEDISYTRKIDNLSVFVEANFFGSIVQPITRYKYEEIYDFSYKLPYIAGYRFVPYGPSAVSMIIFDSKINGKCKALFDKLSSKLKKMGKVVKSNNNAIVVDVLGKPYTVCSTEDQLIISRGSRTDMKNIDISKYANIKRNKKKALKTLRNDPIISDTTIINRLPFDEF